MTYCSHCGNQLEGETPAAEIIDRVSDNEVEIARVNAARDIDVARIQAGADKAIAETAADAELAHAEGEADGMKEVISAVSDPGEPEGEPPAEPVIVEPAGGLDPESEPGPAAPPDTGEPKKEPAAAGWWSGYR